MSKEIPILFSTPMVQAILQGKKTMTRRTVVPKSAEDYALMINMNAGIDVEKEKSELIRCSCPYGKCGDILWVRESVCDTAVYAEINKLKQNRYHYAAAGKKAGWRYKPSIHMPKDAARIWLEVTDIRIERLQDITEKDAIAEGGGDTLKIDDFKLLKGLGSWTIPSPFLMHQFGFLSLWCQINGCESWLQNPWVWVVSFKVLSTTGKPQ
jgi:hypothetical protein